MLDRIFTRIGASDNLARGRSTFLVEMSEVAAILNTATSASLCCSTKWGAGRRHLTGFRSRGRWWKRCTRARGRETLFATHYHELTELEQLLPGVKNVHVSVQEAGSEIVFLRRVEPGSADKSYGIEVARLAGLAEHRVIRRAREILRRHEESEEQAHGTNSHRGLFRPQLNRRVLRRLTRSVLDIAARRGFECADAAGGIEFAGGVAEAAEMRAVSGRCDAGAGDDVGDVGRRDRRGARADFGRAACDCGEV